jgi:hypothetical protein
MCEKSLENQQDDPKNFVFSKKLLIGLIALRVFELQFERE